MHLYPNRWSLVKYKRKFQSTEILRISPKPEICDMPKYHNIFVTSKIFDKLEISAILKRPIYCRHMVDGSATPANQRQPKSNITSSAIASNRPSLPAKRKCQIGQTERSW